MRRVKNWTAALLLAWVGAHAVAGEVEARARIKAEVQAAFEAGRYGELEERWKAALAQSSRTPSGLFVAAAIRDALVVPPSGESQVPGRDDYWMPRERRLDEWAARYPQSSLVAVVQARTLLDHGWSWRGDGFARSVSPEGFKKLALYSQRSYDALMAREAVGRKDPYWYVQLLTLARAQGWDNDRRAALFQEATQAFPLNYNIYFAISTQLTPRWGGSPEAIASLAAFAVEKTRKVEGESMYARVYWNVADWLDTDLGGPDVNWKRIRAGFEDILKRYPDSWNLNYYARFACDARDMPTTRRLLLRIKGDVEPAAWRERTNYLRCLQAAGLRPEQVR